MSDEKIIPYPLRISKNLKEWLRKTAKSNRRSINAELTVLIETAKEVMEREAEKPV